MKTRLVKLWINLRSSFWFIPALMILAAAALAGFLVELDNGVGIQLAKDHPQLFQSSAAGARSILSSIASSMINITSIAFSITIVVLSLASGQYTSRVLRNFIRDRANQTVLGVFLSIFVYCLIVLRAVQGGNQNFVPSLSIAVAILLGIVAIAFLIFFIHHVATSIQVSVIIARVERETIAVMDRMYPEEHQGEAEHSGESARCLRENSWTAIPSRRTGYLQTVDVAGLMTWAERNESIVHMMRGVGEFVIAGNPILNIAAAEAPVDKFAAELNLCFSTDSFRTIDRDPAFGIRQLVDISLKALSPGVNDTTTAVTCLNYLGAILDKVSRRKLRNPVLFHGGKVRLLVRTPTYKYFVDEALHQIRQSAGSNVAVHLAMIETIEAAIHPKLSHDRRTVLRDHLHRIQRVADDRIKDDGDRTAVQERHRRVLKQLEAERAPCGAS